MVAGRPPRTAIPRIFHHLLFHSPHDRLSPRRFYQTSVIEVDLASVLEGGDPADCDSKGRPIARAREVCQLEGGPEETVRRVLGLCACVLRGGPFIALATSLGLQVYEGTGDRRGLRYFWPIPSSYSGPTGAPHEATCVCFVRGTDGSEGLALGTNAGLIYLFKVDAKGRFSPGECITGGLASEVPVTVLTSHLQGRGGRGKGGASPDGAGSTLVSGNDAGDVTVWDVDCANGTAVAVATRAPDPMVGADAPGIDPERGLGEGMGVAGLALRGNWVGVLTSNGTVAVRSAATLAPLAEFVAHSRFASTLCVHPERDTLLSCAEDATVMAWNPPTPGATELDVQLHAVWQSAPIVGVCWAGNNVVAVAGGVDQIVCWYTEPPPKRMSSRKG